MKFSNKLSLAIFITGMIVLVIVSFAIYKFSYNSIMETQFKHTKSIVDESSDSINSLLQEKIKIALTLANAPIIKKVLEINNFSYADLSDEKRKESIKLLNEQWKSTKTSTDNFILKYTDNQVSRFLKRQQTILKGEYGEIFLTNKFGALVASTSKLSTFAHGHKYWWLGSYNNGEGAVFLDDRGYDDSVGGYVLGIVAPIRKGSEIIGILKCNLNILGGISTLISGAINKLHGKFKLIRSGGMVVFEKGFEPLSTQIHENILKRLKSNNKEIFIINDSGEKYLIGFSEIQLTKGEKGYGFGGTFESIDHKKGNTGESWYVLCYRQISVLQEPIIESIKWIILMGSTIILILAIVSYLFGRKISKPLAMLGTATEKIGKGDFKYKIDLRQKDELGSLAHSFNKMATRLYQTTTSVELLKNEINERKQAEEALKESEQQFRTVADFTYDWEYWVRPDGSHVYTSPSCERITGYTPDDFMNNSELMTEILHPDDRALLAGHEHNIDGSGNIYPIDFRIITKGGDERWIGHICQAVYAADGSPLGRRGSNRDITNNKKLQEEVLKAQKLESLGTLAGGIAHDFNNLLYVIMGNISLAQDDLNLELKTSENLKEAEQACIKAKELSARLITFSKGGDPVKKFNFIDDLLKKTVPSALSGSNIKPEISIFDDIRQVNIDEGQIKQVVHNIVFNAREAMDDNGQLKVSCENIDIAEEGYLVISQGEYIKISFKDHGCGISKKNFEKIFDPYFSTKDMGADKGQGLGLAVSYSIVQKHGGLITVESELESGSTFSVYLPALSAKAPDLQKLREKPTAIEPVKEPAICTGKILLMDDEEAIRTFLDRVIKKLGYAVETCTEGKEAIEIYKKAMESKEPFEVVILDLTNRIGMGGQETMKRLLEIDHNAKGIVITGYSDDPVVTNFRAYGFSGSLAKPTTRDELSKVINEVISIEPPFPESSSSPETGPSGRGWR